MYNNYYIIFLKHEQHTCTCIVCTCIYVVIWTYHGDGVLWGFETVGRVPDTRWQHRQVINELIHAVEQVLLGARLVGHLTKHLQHLVA